MPLREDARLVAWRMLVGCSAGAIAGLVVGGVGGRLAMLLLRLTSSDSVIGVTSDDGFTIGEVTTRTFQLMFTMTVLGAINGVLYATIRTMIPRRLRLLLWAGFAALFGGSILVHEDGVDFTLLEPALLAILLFVALPGLAAAVVVLLVERWSRLTPWASRRLTLMLAVASVCSTFALAFAVAAGAAALAVGRSRRLRRLFQAGRIAVPVGLAILGVLAGVDLLQESARILD